MAVDLGPALSWLREEAAKAAGSDPTEVRYLAKWDMVAVFFGSKYVEFDGDMLDPKCREAATRIVQSEIRRLGVISSGDPTPG